MAKDGREKVDGETTNRLPQVWVRYLVSGAHERGISEGKDDLLVEGGRVKDAKKGEGMRSKFVRQMGSDVRDTNLHER